MKHYLILLALLLPILSGCSDRVKVRGTVTFEEDGSPLTIGTVKFVGEKTQATGHVQKNGTYSLGEIKPGDGVVPGTYKVGVYAQTGGGSDYAPLTYHVARKLQDPETSGLTCEVKKGMTFDITVTKPLPGEEEDKRSVPSIRVGPPPSKKQ